MSIVRDMASATHHTTQEATAMTITTNSIFGAFVGQEQRAEFDAMRHDPLMIREAQLQINKGNGSQRLMQYRDNYSDGFCTYWISRGKPAPSMIGLPAAALIAAVVDLEEAGA